jgi:glyoxylase-like metal-dependent hydrolase (beta-lactamase superfamily II)
VNKTDPVDSGLSYRLIPLLALIMFVSLAASDSMVIAGGFSQPDSAKHPNLFVWTDTCNVWVVKQQDACILINLGDGSLLDHLNEIGVKNIDWVLFTDHHREQCQGAVKLAQWREAGTKVAAPKAERALFETPIEFRKMQVKLGDPFTIHGASYVRPSIHPIPIDMALSAEEKIHWRGHEVSCVDTAGTSPGGMTYRLASSGAELFFSGDVMLDDARLHTWFDTEWDYGFAAGIHALQKSVDRLIEQKPSWLLPSHGPVIREPLPQLQVFKDKLKRLEALYVRGYDVESGSVAYQDKLSKPTQIADLNQVSPHLFKFKRKNFWPNFSIILADSGRALLADCGLLDQKMLEQTIIAMREHYGLKSIDAIIVSHMHGDHFLEATFAKEKWGTQVWALDNMVEKMEHPERFDYAAPIQAYGKIAPDGKPINGVKVDRVFHSGESFDWEGYHFTIDWMPGQTEFALCLQGVIDDRLVAFTGDNIFGDPDNEMQTGHEAVVAHNSSILEEGYIYGAEYLARLKPDLLMGGHSFVMDKPREFIERYRKWSYQMRDAFQSLSSQEHYQYWYDPFWVRAVPYRSTVRPGETVELEIEVRNFKPSQQSHRIEIHSANGLVSEPSVLEGQLEPNSRSRYPVRIKADAKSSPGVRLIAFDISRDGQHQGELFDAIIEVVGVER